MLAALDELFERYQQGGLVTFPYKTIDYFWPAGRLNRLGIVTSVSFFFL